MFSGCPMIKLFSLFSLKYCCTFWKVHSSLYLVYWRHVCIVRLRFFLSQLMNSFMDVCPRYFNFEWLIPSSTAKTSVRKFLPPSNWVPKQVNRSLTNQVETNKHFWWHQYTHCPCPWQNGDPVIKSDFKECNKPASVPVTTYVQTTIGMFSSLFLNKEKFLCKTNELRSV